MSTSIRHSGESRNPGFLGLSRFSKTFLPAFTVILTSSFATPRIFADNSELVAKGRQTYLQHCARCHGPDAKGDGFDAARLPVVPRNLTEGVFKFQSTAQGTAPSDADLMWILNHGMAGAGMPSFANLNDATKQGLIAYIKTLSPIFADFPAEPLAPPKIKVKVDLAKGKELFEKLQCALCHGDNGRANGSSAFTLKDKWDRPIPVANLAQGWRYRAGSTATQIYYRLMAGINGAPMPSYAEAVTPDEAWQLAKYVESLQLKTNWKPEIKAVAVKGDLPVSTDDAVWNNTPRTDVNVQGSFYRNGRKEETSVHAVSVQAVKNDKGFAFRLSWDDPTQNATAPVDSLLMAIRPQKFDGKGTQNVHNLYFPGGNPLEGYLWSAATSSSVKQITGSLDAITGPGAKSDNTLTAQSVYQDGVYTLVFQRPWVLSNADALNPETVTALKVGFAVWNGANNEAGLNRAASQWITLTLKDSASHH